MKRTPIVVLGASPGVGKTKISVGLALGLRSREVTRISKPMAIEPKFSVFADDTRAPIKHTLTAVSIGQTLDARVCRTALQLLDEAPKDIVDSLILDSKYDVWSDGHASKRVSPGFIYRTVPSVHEQVVQTCLDWQSQNMLPVVEGFGGLGELAGERDWLNASLVRDLDAAGIIVFNAESPSIYEEAVGVSKILRWAGVRPRIALLNRAVGVGPRYQSLMRMIEVTVECKCFGPIRARGQTPLPHVSESVNGSSSWVGAQLQSFEHVLADMSLSADQLLKELA